MPTEQPRDLAKVVLWMTGSLLSFCVVALSIRGLQDKLTLFEILSLRNIGGLLILALMRVLAPSPDQRLKPDRFGLHVIRNVFHSIGQSLWAWGVIVLPLGTVFAIEFTTPVWVALFAVLFLGEKMTLSRAFALAAGLVGVLVILRPGLDGFRIEALAVVVAAIGFGVQIVTTKALTTTNSTFTILFWMNLMQLPTNLGANAVLGHSPLFMAKIDWSMWLPVIGIAVSGFTAHYCLTNAFRHGDATLVVPIDFLRVPLIAIVGFAFYGEHFDIAVVIGGLVIVAGVVYNLRHETRR